MRKTHWVGLVISVGPLLLAAGACSTAGQPRASEQGGQPTGYAPLDGPCPSEGAVHECHVKLPDVGSVVRCYVGRQECRNGVWSACGGGEITLASVDLDALGPADRGGVRPLAVPVSDAGTCLLDPCDPYCVGFNEDASISAEGGAPTTFYLPGGDIFGGAPGGFAKKSNCGASSKGCNSAPPGAPYPRKCNGEDHYSIWDACLADTHCDITRNGGQGDCVANWDKGATTDPRWDEANERWLPSVCLGVDVTVSAACEVAGVAGFNVCNRGNSNLTAASVGIYLDMGNGDFGSSTFASGTCPNRAPSCSPPVPGGVLAPGRCFRVTNATCPAWTGGGNPVAYVNSNRAIPECGGLATAGAATGPGCNNNWADVKHKGLACATNSTFIDTSRTFNYTATCPPGTEIRWKTLTYQATVPCSPGACNGTNAAKVEFYGTLSRTLADAGTTSTLEAIIPDATTTQTVNCTFGVDAGGQPKCPVDLRTWADGVTPNGSTYSTLALRIRLVPTPDDTMSPSVSNWTVSYDCAPSE